MEQLNSFISSRGLLKSCRFRNFKPVSSSSLIDDNFVNGGRDGDSIYICTDALRNFSENILPNIDWSFNLVTGDSDLSLTQEWVYSELIEIIDHPKIISWHAQNLKFNHPKINPVPIGNDYHTMWEKPGLWGLSSTSPIAQENLLINTLRGSPDIKDRYVLAYCNWHHAIQRGDREECLRRIDKKACYFEPNKLPRISTWRRQSQFMFALSPEGVGMDCHRTWETLMLGSFPIVKSGPLDKLFSNLPVMLVNDWGEVTSDALLEFGRDNINKKFNFSSLFLQYWVKKINNFSCDLFDDMTISEFKKIITHEGV